LQAIQNLATKKILGVFKTAPILLRDFESALLPPIVRLNYNQRRYAFRILKLSNSYLVKAKFNEYTTSLDYFSSSSSSASELGSPIANLKRKERKGLTQIQRLLGSISNIVDLDSLEPIRHFFFAPWERELPYKVLISKEAKDVESKLYIQYLKSIINSQTKTIYTDGSQTQTGTGIGLGFAAFDYSTTYIPTIPIYKDFKNIGDSAIVYNGELEAVS
jgi:hypothetical protein